MTNVWHAARARNQDWYYIDNGYFGRGSYYSVSRNAERIDPSKALPDFKRLARLRIDPAPWRDRARGHILITLQSETYFAVRGRQRADWLADVVAQLRDLTNREIRIREKPVRQSRNRLPFEEELRGASALVTYTSNTALEAVMLGVPAFVLGRCHASALAADDLARIDDPVRPSRTQRLHVAAVLAANQWTRAEMRDGTCWATLNTGAGDP